MYGLTDPSNAPTDIFLPNQIPLGPSFVDDGGCLCALRNTPDGQSTAWRCFGNHTLLAYQGGSGKWFAVGDAKASWKGLPSNDSSNPPQLSPALVLPPSSNNNQAPVPLAPMDTVQPNPLNVHDQACSGKNQSLFSTAYLRAVGEQQAGKLMLNAAPCWRQGSLPIQIQNLTSWQQSGCIEGFYCPNNTINSLPQYCMPIEECMEARLGGATCILPHQDTISPQGPFEPVPCSAGYYCPRGGLQQIKCPAGNVCPLGSIQPTKCGVGSYCPEGARVEYSILPLALLVVLDLILIACTLFWEWYFAMASHRKHRLKYLPVDTMHERKGYGKLQDTEMAELPANPSSLQRTKTGFSAALAGERKSSFRLDMNASRELEAFVSSMHKAIQGTNFGLSFGFQQLGFFPKGAAKPVLSDISGNIRAGTLVGVMGGSGAGKSTFVNVLMGKQSHTGGRVLVNGVAGKMKDYKKIIGYVPQDDIVLPELTVRENILHSGRIRLPKTWSAKDVNSHVDAVVDCLELSHVAHSMVGTVAKPTISGGQRKRVSIGMELAAAPQALFLDEPTSGLDATAAGSIMKTLKALSKLGISVIVIIHQPRSEIFEMIDDLILLGNGHMIYQGPEAEVKKYFEELDFQIPQYANQGDVTTDIITGNGRAYKPVGDVSKEALIAHWQSTHKRDHSPDERTPSPLRPNPSLRLSIKKRGAHHWWQSYYCLTRALLQQYRLKSSFWFEMGVAAAGGFLIGLAQNSKKGVFFTGLYTSDYEILSSAGDYKSAPEMALLVCIGVGLIASSPAVKIFAEEKLIYRRESESGHSRSAYYIAKVVSTLPRMVLGCLHFTTLFMLLATPLISWGAAYWLNLLYFFCIYGLASAVAMVTRREDAPLLAVMASLIVGVLSGTAPPLAKVHTWHVEWLWRMSPGTWMAEAYWSKNVAPLGNIYQIDKAEKATGFTLNQGAMDCGLLVVIGLVYRVLAFGGLLVSPKVAN